MIPANDHRATSYCGPSPVTALATTLRAFRPVFGSEIAMCLADDDRLGFHARVSICFAELVAAAGDLDQEIGLFNDVVHFSALGHARGMRAPEQRPYLSGAVWTARHHIARLVFELDSILAAAEADATVRDRAAAALLRA